MTVPAISAAQVPDQLGADLAAAVDLAKAEKAPATRKAYGTDFRLFREWCEAKGVSAMPARPEVVAAYLAAEARTARPSTIGRRVAAIRYAHKLAGLPTPTDAEAVKATVRGIRRTLGTAKVKKAPAVAPKLIAMTSHAADKLAGLRDRALLLVGFGGAFRRSELVALNVEDVAETDEGLKAIIRSSKTDQEGEGRTVPIARGDIACPAQALRAWLDTAGITSGPIFRPINKAGAVSVDRLTDRSVANLHRLFDTERAADLATVTRRIRNRGLELCTDQVVAGLSLGFWVGMLDGRYNPPIWSKQLRVAFPNLPNARARKSIFTEAGKVATLRNRISHHEPLIGRNISQDFATVMMLLEWICPTKHGWIKPHCRVPQILRQRP